MIPLDGILLFYFLNMVVNFLSQRYSIGLCRFLAICCCRLACTISARSSPTAPPRQRRYREPHGSAHTLRSPIAMSTQDAGPGSPDASDGGEIEDFTLIGRGGRPASRPATGEAPQAPSHSEGGGAALSFAAVAARAAATSPRPASSGARRAPTLPAATPVLPQSARPPWPAQLVAPFRSPAVQGLASPSSRSSHPASTGMLASIEPDQEPHRRTTVRTEGRRSCQIDADSSAHETTRAAHGTLPQAVVPRYCRRS